MTRTKWLITGLVAINAVLLGVLLQKAHPSTARGQVAGGGNYSFAAGETNNGGVVYVLNTRSGVISGIMSQGNTLQNPLYLAPHSVVADVKRIRSR